MQRRKRTNRPRYRSLRIESIERRQLMAADIGGDFDDVPQIVGAAAPESLAPASFIAASSIAESSVAESSVAASSVSARASDAGSTLDTALNIGSVDGGIRIGGQVSRRDTLDVFQFDVARDATVDLNLRRLVRNADLVVVDASGTLIDSSLNRGSRSESLSLQLDSGTYFVAVASRSFWGTSYQLDFAAELAAEPAIDTNPSTPLSEVDYFGGAREWNVNAVGAPEAWAAGYTGQGILVAVVDTGVDLDHPDLIGSLYVNPGEIAGNGIDDDGNGYVDDVSGYDFAGRDANPDDINGHGTHVAGTIAAGNNGFGATGIAPDATILPVRVLGDDGSGSTNAVAAGIRYAADLGADIINLSLGGGYSRAIDAAIDYAQQLGSFIVAAAGNESAPVPSFPAQFSGTNENVISVGAFSSSGSLAGFSNDVGGSGSVQIDAPGVGIYSTYVGGRYASLSGTSMASPHVAGVAALALSANPNLTPEELRGLLVGGTLGIAAGSDGIGNLNAATTVAFAARGLTTAPVTAGLASGSGAGRDAAAYQTTSIGVPDQQAIQALIDQATPAVTEEVTRDPVSTITAESPERIVSTQYDDAMVATVDAYFAEDANRTRDETSEFEWLGNSDPDTIQV